MPGLRLVPRQAAWAAAAAGLLAGAALAITRDGAIIGTRDGNLVILRRARTRRIGAPPQHPGDPMDPSVIVRGASTSGNVVATYHDWFGSHNFVQMRSGAIHRLPRYFRPVAVNDSGTVVGHVDAYPTGVRSATC